MINIIKIYHGQSVVYALFECPQGYGKGVWLGEKPEIGLTTHVEIDIDESLVISKCPPTKKIYTIDFKDEITSLSGNILAVQDEIIFFRFADTIIQLERGSETIGIGDWIIISTNAENMFIYPVSL